MMYLAAVDDERSALNVLVRAIREAQPEATVAAFQNGADLLLSAQSCPYEAAFLDIEMRDMSGLMLAKALKEIRPSVNIIFVTGYSQYSIEAFRLHASGYLLKPVTADAVYEELCHLRAPAPPPAGKSAAQIRVQCFGNFEVFVNGAPLHFTRSKSKELFAFLVDNRGAGVTNAQIEAALFEDSLPSMRESKYIQKIIAAMIQAFKVADCAGFITRRRNYLAIDTDALDCDYYRFLGGDVSAVNAYMGVYMGEYSWAEMTAAELTMRTAR